MTAVDMTFFCEHAYTAEALGKKYQRARAHVQKRACTGTHTHTEDHIKLRALGLAEPRSHSRNLPALLTSVSKLENSLQKTKQKTPSYVRADSFTLIKSGE